ncbi:MAG: DNA internalization-related competence protein ComEC/Rec2 [Erysipelotrichales bacterium]|nr:DNA internalization-related competence protein ComEC/Rec2 [Erysipelotrichales bacterium]
MSQELVKSLLTRLKTLLPFNEIHLLAFFLLILILSLGNLLYLGLLVIYIVFLKKIRKLTCLYLFIGFIVTINFLFFFHRNTILDFPAKELEIVVIEKKPNYYIAKYKCEKFILYSHHNYQAGDVILISGDFQEPKTTNLKFIFNYQKYLRFRKIRKIISPKKEEFIGHKIILASFREFLLDKIDNRYQAESARYIKILLLGDSSNFDLEMRNDINFLGIGHLLSISGLHLNFFILFAYLILKKIGLKEKTISTFLIVLLAVYSFITLFIPSVMRVVLCYIFKEIFKRYKLLYTSLDILAFSFLVLLLVNPFYLFQIGFQLSYLVSFCFILFSDFLSRTKNIFLLTFKMSVIAVLATFPLIINMNNYFNLFSLLANVCITIFFSYLFLPATFILLVFPFLEFVYLFLITIFEQLIDYFMLIDFLVIKLASFGTLFIVIYYFLTFQLFKAFELKKRVFNYFFLLFFLLIINSFKPIFYFDDEVGFFNVGQGDSAYIRVKNDSCNILIDFYGYDYQYLAKLGIRRIDYLIISHGHKDHLGDFKELNNLFSIENVLVSRYDQSELTQNLLCESDKRKIKSAKAESGDTFKCGGIEFLILAPFKSFSNLNNNSIVFQFQLFKKTFLFTGDIEKEVETWLIATYGNSLKSDVLKVSHHGSITSSSQAFLDYVKPNIAIISVAENNRYNLPNLEVLERLKIVKAQIFITATDDTIIIKKAKQRKRFSYLL